MNVEELENLLHKLGFSRITRRHSDIQACCPAHSERNPSWGISINPPHLHGCFSCKYAGDLFSLLVFIGGYSPKQARILASGEEPQFNFPCFEDRKDRRTIEATELFPYELSPIALSYLKRRGIGLKAAQKARCLYDRIHDRVLFPWYLKGELVGVTGRACHQNQVKTLPYFGTRKGQYLYLPTGKISREPLILVEGEIDALKILNAGYANVAALGFGAFTKQQQSLILFSGCSAVILFFDNDDQGKSLTRKVFGCLKGKIPIHLVNYLPFQASYKGELDPGAMSLRDIRKALEVKVIRHIDWPSFKA